METDYTGYFHWGGFLAGVGLAIAGAALIVATGGMAAPVVLAATVVGSATIATGTIMATAAAQDEVMVMDVSTTVSGDGLKNGVSVVLDFGENTYDVYNHSGVAASNGGSPMTYSVGFVFNYEDVGDYGGPFVNAGGSYDWLGFDYCRSPDMNVDSVAAMSVTLGFPRTNGVAGYAGWDNYVQVASGEFWK